MHLSHAHMRMPTRRTCAQVSRVCWRWKGRVRRERTRYRIGRGAALKLASMTLSMRASLQTLTPYDSLDESVLDDLDPQLCSLMCARGLRRCCSACAASLWRSELVVVAARVAQLVGFRTSVRLL